MNINQFNELKSGYSKRIILLALLIILGFCIGFYIYFYGSKQGFRLTPEDNTKGMIAKLIYDLNDPDSPFNNLLDQLLAQQPQLFDVNRNRMNRGAEIFYILGLRGNSSTDTDHDGLLEISDAWGHPMIFLFDRCPFDNIVYAEGKWELAYPPPYVDMSKGHFYVNSQAFESWVWSGHSSYWRQLRKSREKERIGLGSDRLGRREPPDGG
jgi:hypothetical protein